MASLSSRRIRGIGLLLVLLAVMLGAIKDCVAELMSR